ncbi:gem-associated protein 8 isoform X2 [Parambassis ranga]|uniref:Gem-associated protein 8 isoform X2 n=1 Tax=Parambassis ranga TaxID=210632 RepID=A0A6P7HKQ5_9TELE|nr:gem-associated protein 8 isoform X2 [Parambassis ranga]
MEDISTVMSWFSSPIYSRYWQHYQQAMAWHQRHRRAYQKAWEAAYGRGYCQEQQQQRYEDWHSAEEGQDGGEESSEESSSDSEIECDVSNMEISEELRQYFAQTEKHREELKKQQQMEAEQEDSYVPADQDLRGVSSWRSSTAPPSERPGERRTAEMKKLYGKDAPKILAMEAAMQLTFDRNCDLKQPKYWPVIPLKL